MKKNNSKKYTIASYKECHFFLEIIDKRVTEFFYIIEKHNDKVSKKYISSIKKWAINMSNDLKEQFKKMYQNKFEGKKIPVNLKFPNPKKNNINRKFGTFFIDKECQVCGDKRVLNIAHIIPKANEGPDEIWNMMRLCADHHYLFDNGQLTKKEWNSIDWDSLDKRAREYSLTKRLSEHKNFWSKNGQA